MASSGKGAAAGCSGAGEGVSCARATPPESPATAARNAMAGRMRKRLRCLTIQNKAYHPAPRPRQVAESICRNSNFVQAVHSHIWCLTPPDGCLPPNWFRQQRAAQSPCLVPFNPLNRRSTPESCHSMQNPLLIRTSRANLRHGRAKSQFSTRQRLSSVSRSALHVQMQISKLG